MALRTLWATCLSGSWSFLLRLTCAEQVHVLVGLHPSAPGDSGGNRLGKGEHRLRGPRASGEVWSLPPWDGSQGDIGSGDCD